MKLEHNMFDNMFWFFGFKKLILKTFFPKFKWELTTSSKFIVFKVKELFFKTIFK